MGKPSKYAGKLEQLPRFVDPEGNRALIEAEKQKIADRRPSALGDMILRIRRERDEAEKKLSEVNVRYRAAGELFETACEAEKIKSVPFDSGATVRVDHAPHAGFEKLWCLACDTAVTPGEGQPFSGHDCDAWWCNECHSNVTPKAKTGFPWSDGRRPVCKCKSYMVRGMVVSGHEAFRLYCLANGHEQEMSLPWPTTNSLLGTAIAEGQPIPPGIKPWNRAKIVPTGVDKHLPKTTPAEGFQKLGEAMQAAITDEAKQIINS